MEEKYENKIIEEYILKDECERINDLEQINKILKFAPGIRLGINGTWGSGKTVLAHMIKILSSYEGKNTELVKISNNCDEIRSYNVIYFDASKEDIFDNPLMSLLKVISDRLTEQNNSEENQNGLEVEQDSEHSIFLDIAKIFDKAKNYEDEEFAKNYYNTQILIDKIKLLFDQKEKCLLIIDELDRCNPAYALKLLVTIKHFFDIEGLSIIYLYNYDELWSIIKNEYGYSNEEYFQKFIDFEYKLNGVASKDYGRSNNHNLIETNIGVVATLYQLNFREKNNLNYLIETYNCTHKTNQITQYMEIATVCHYVIKKYYSQKIDETFIEERLIYLEKQYDYDFISLVRININHQIKNNPVDYFIKKFKDLI